jgi:hypothetical protein
MSDAVTVTRDAQGYEDDTFSPVTGQYTAPANDLTTVYSGKAIVANVNPQPPDLQPEGGQEFIDVEYDLFVPMAASPLQVWDRVVVTASLRDPQLVGEVFFIREAIVGTFEVMRRARLNRRRPQRYTM